MWLLALHAMPVSQPVEPPPATSLPSPPLVAPVPMRSLVPELMLARDFDSDADVSRYLVSEKFDGVRAYWDGQRFWSRQGLALAVPHWFSRDLPSVPLDGELWLGRGRFAETAGLLRSGKTGDRRWRSMRYKVFDLPTNSQPFHHRYQQLSLLLQPVPGWIQLVPQRRVLSRAELYQQLDQLVAQGGEGLMLHYHDGLYQAGRSAYIMKLKPRDEIWAKVTGYTPGKGKYEGQVGALRMSLADGRAIKVGSGLTNQLRAQPPAVGSILCVAYNGLTRHGLLRFPRLFPRGCERLAEPSVSSGAVIGEPVIGQH